VGKGKDKDKGKVGGLDYGYGCSWG
jgi:hypothetical protein